MSQIENNNESKKFEVIISLTLAVIATILSVTDIGSGKFGADEIKAYNNKSNAYSWYQSKSIKQSITEGQRDLLESLIQNNMIQPEKEKAIQNFFDNMNAQVNRYAMEKNEILHGSANVDKDNQVQAINGKLGMVVGAKEFEKKIDFLGNACSTFDVAKFFLQLSIIIGAISLIINNMRIKKSFYFATLIFGIIGTSISAKAFWIAFSA